MNLVQIRKRQTLWYRGAPVQTVEKVRVNRSRPRSTRRALNRRAREAVPVAAMNLRLDQVSQRSQFHLIHYPQTTTQVEIVSFHQVASKSPTLFPVEANPNRQ